MRKSPTPKRKGHRRGRKGLRNGTLSKKNHGFYSDSMESIPRLYGTFRGSSGRLHRLGSHFDIVKDYWFAAGLFQAPRLRSDWDTPAEEDQKYQTLNAFFDTLFSVIIASLGKEVMKKQTITVLYHYAQYIAITLSLWLTTAGYSSRFDNEDISHKIFWSVYGVGVLGLQMHSTGPLTSPNSVYFAFFLSLIYVILSFQWLMCGIALRRCRLYCLMQTVIMLVVAAIAFAASSTPNLDHRNRLFWTLGLSYPAEIVFSLIWQEVAINTVYRDMTYEEARKETDLPLHIQFHIDRFSTLTMMVLGQLAVAVVWHPEDGFGDITGLYVSAGCTFVSLVSLKILIFDIDFLDPEDHAIRRSRISGLIWLLIYPAGLACLALMGIGMALLVAEAGAINAVPEGSLKYRQYLTCLSLCAFLVIGTILRQLHRTPFVRQLRLYRQYERAILVGRIHTIQSSVQILAAVIFAVLPACKVSALMMLKMIAGTLLCIIGVNFIDEIALLQTVKKAREATRHNSFDTKAEFF